MAAELLSCRESRVGSCRTETAGGGGGMRAEVLAGGGGEVFE